MMAKLLKTLQVPAHLRKQEKRLRKMPKAVSKVLPTDTANQLMVSTAPQAATKRATRFNLTP